jgi:hypothetical protein
MNNHPKHYNVETTHYIPWTCPQCGKKQYTIMHSAPAACFVAMECEHCDYEEDGCRCESGKNVITEAQMMARILGASGGRANAGKPKQRPAGYYSRIARLPRKPKNAKK